MAYKNFGSNALKNDSDAELKIGSDSDTIEVKVNIRNNTRNEIPEGWTVIRGGANDDKTSKGEAVPRNPGLSVARPDEDSAEDFDGQNEDDKVDDEAWDEESQNEDGEVDDEALDEENQNEGGEEEKDEKEESDENKEEDEKEDEEKSDEKNPENEGETQNEDENQGESDKKADEARDALKKNEDAASQEAPKQPKDNADGAKKFENDSANRGFKNSTEGKDEKEKMLQDPRQKIINRLKTQGPLGALIAFMLGIIFLIVGGQSMMPFSLSEILRTNSDSISVSNSRRSTSIFLKQLGKKKVDSPQSSNKDTYEVSDKQRTRLAREGIYVVDDANGKSMALYDDGTGALKIVAANDADAAEFRSKVSFADIEGQLPDGYSGPRTLNSSDVSTYSDRIKTDAEFDTKFTKGSRTWAGAVGAWFDSRTFRFLKSHRLTRNLFKNYINKREGSAGVDGEVNSTRRLSEMIDEDVQAAKKGSFDKDEMSDPKTKKADPEDTNFVPENDKQVSRTPYDADAEVDVGTGTSFSAAKAKAEAVFDKISPSKLTSASQTLLCLVLDIAGSAALIGAAHDVAQILPVVSAFFESVDKHKAGKGDGSVNDFATALAIVVPTVIIASKNGEYKEEKLPEKSAMQSDAISSLMAGTKMNPNDPVTASFNIGGFNNNFSGVLRPIMSAATSGELSASMFRACSITKLVFNGISALGSFAEGALTFGGCLLGPAGCAAGAVASLLMGAAKKLAVSAAYSFGISQVISLVSAFIVPKLATFFMRNIIYDLAGESFGAVIANGAQKYISGNHLFGGGSPASRNTYVKFAVEQQEYLAKNAEIERATRSPFDITSQYTFAGTLLRQLAIFNSGFSSPFKVFSTVSTLTQKSLLSLMPSSVATAEEISTNLMSEEELNDICPSLASIGAVGDAFCNPYIVTDVSTIDADVDEVANFVAAKGGFKSDGTTIDPNSALGKYILYCSGRNSPFGAMDGNISNAVSSKTSVDVGNSTVNNLINSTIGAIPVIGDTLDVLTEATKLENIGYISGEACVANNEESNQWRSETKYYQRYIEDQRLLENASDNYVSPVTAFIEEYYDNNPLDDSYEGVLARYSGLTKDEVVATLDAMEYINYVAEYEPDTRYDFVDGDLVKPESEIRIDGPDYNSVQYSVIPSVKFAYTDARPRFTFSA